jgi:hypothetical protein
MKDIILDTVLDAVKLLPFLFIAFLIIEIIEHKLSDKSKKVIAKSGKFGPLFGSLLGLFPQCGFSVMATNLYTTRIISLGTLIAIYLSTSDEMLPILISNQTSLNTILKILIIKFVIGVACGFIIDLILRNKNDVINADYEICNDEHCDCEHQSVFVSALKHTLNILAFIVVITFILNTVFYYIGTDKISSLFGNNIVLGPILASLIGLIPNCGASVMITELYLNSAVSLGSAIASTLTGSGVALLVLFRENHNVKENVSIMLLIYFIGVVSGILLNLFKFM